MEKDIDKKRLDRILKGAKRTGFQIRDYLDFLGSVDDLELPSMEYLDYLVSHPMEPSRLEQVKEISNYARRYYDLASEK